ncbi:MAG: hypothetical protein KDJ47_09070 [Hyphomicrobiaceae bacterium]|nr:hypothetical protein [Hyphomicrobiaceae bacterium]
MKFANSKVAFLLFLVAVVFHFQASGLRAETLSRTDCAKLVAIASTAAVTAAPLIVSFNQLCRGKLQTSAMKHECFSMHRKIQSLNADFNNAKRRWTKGKCKRGDDTFPGFPPMPAPPQTSLD